MERPADEQHRVGDKRGRGEKQHEKIIEEEGDELTTTR
jgi:hypothetical protein